MRPRFASLLGWAGSLAVVVLAVVASQSPSLQEIEVWLTHHQPWLLVLTGSVAFCGFLLLIGGVLSLTRSEGDTIDHAGVEELFRRNRSLVGWPHLWRASIYRIKGRTEGAGADDVFSLSELKDAHRVGRLWRESNWRRRLIVLAGGLMLLSGGMSAAIVIAPTPIKLILGVAMIYAWVRLLWGLRTI